MGEVQYTVVETPFGSVRGVTTPNLTTFHRIPYAEPPVGLRRFAPPGEAPRWAGVYDATAPGSAPPQLPSRLEDVMGAYPVDQSESCLHLDIWVPKAEIGRPPVLVFIHGGAFMTGGGSLPCYDGGALAERAGVIVVTITYRLGALGFMPLPGSGATNLGLRDQIAALRWIRRAISSFGGDDGRITVAGQSAGAHSIALMLGLPFAAELFDRAILMSSPLGIQLPTAEEAATVVGAAFLRHIGMTSTGIDALAEVPLDAIMAAQRSLLERPPAFPGDIAPPFVPVIDGDLVKGQPLSPADDSVAPWCDIIIGVTREEFAAFLAFNPRMKALPEQALAGIFARQHGDKGADVLRAARGRRVPATPAALVGDVLSDATFVEPSIVFADRQVSHGRRAYVYQFDWQSPHADLNACHCLDLPFLFGNIDVWADSPMLRGANRHEVDGLSRIFQGALTAFVISGDPNRTDLPAWPHYGESKAVLHFDRWTTAAGRFSIQPDEEHRA